MFETIAMFGGIIGGVVSLLSIVVLIIMKKNVLDILSKDAIIFDKNFEIKLKTITASMLMIDELETGGKTLTLDAKFTERAKVCYNNLLCVVTDVKLADEFYALTLDKDVPFNATRLAEFKLYCRKDIGFKTAKTKLVSRTTTQNEMGINEAMLRANVATNGNINNYYESTGFNAGTPAYNQTYQHTEQPIPQQPTQATPQPVQQPSAQPRPQAVPQPTPQPAAQPKPVNKPAGTPKQ